MLKTDDRCSRAPSIAAWADFPRLGHCGQHLAAAAAAVVVGGGGDGCDEAPKNDGEAATGRVRIPSWIFGLCT